jgi:hypothetical protein
MIKSPFLMIKSPFLMIKSPDFYVCSMVTSAFWDQVMTKHLFWESAFVNDLILATWLFMGTPVLWGSFLF